MELDLKKAENWLTHFRLYPYTQIHASGHLNYDEIKEVVETVEPKVLIQERVRDNDAPILKS
jgi:mRNA degradation ribonuclease J1/J2